ncbi:MAG: hypothetical protein IPH45_08845 [Bacteroidales bacterium]|nr:hypothetical protein [Bacteroidales bacterium]
MKKLFILTFLYISLLNPIGFAQTVTSAMGNHTAFIMPKGKWESGIIQPLRIGMSPRLEITSSAFLFPLLPNAGVKIAWPSGGNYKFASEHNLSIPSVFLNLVSMKGTGGILSPEFDFPFILATHHGLIISRQLRDSSLLTYRLGASIALRTGDVDPLSTIDLPLFYPRMAHYYKGISLRGDVTYKAQLCRRWFYEEGVHFFLLSRKEQNFFAENSGFLVWNIRRSLRIKGGYNLSYGNYPFGKHWQLWPSLDIVFGSRK